MVRLAEALTPVIVAFCKVLQQQVLPCSAMTSERFPGHLRYFEWKRSCAILRGKDCLERRAFVFNAKCTNSELSPVNTESVVQDFAFAKCFWRLVSHALFVSTAVALASERRHARR